MRKDVLPVLSALSAIAAAVLVLATAILIRDRLGNWQFVLYAAGLLALASGFFLTRRNGSVVVRLLARRKPQGDVEVGQTRDDLEQLRSELGALFDSQLSELGHRESLLADRLAAHQQLLEFPEPVDLCLPPARNPQLAERDRALAKLFDSETERLYERIRKNAYSPQGHFEASLVRDDVYAFVQRIAAICRPDGVGPLAGASIERILRAASRCSLRFLVELEKMPLDVHTHDLADVYAYVRRATNVFGVYESARPYFPYIKGALYATRFAMGASPIGLGAWWLASSVSGRSARTLVSKAANRWALDFLYDVVRIIGYEVASVYDANYRFRDPNWVYAAEVTELLHCLPGSMRALQQAMKEICTLPLRNEYDRVYLVRAVAEGKGVNSERFPISDILSADQRGTIAKRLEEFLAAFVADTTPQGVARWREGVERRLDVKLNVGSTATARSEAEQVRKAMHSLAGYLLEMKQREPEDLPKTLAETSLGAGLDDDVRQSLWGDLQKDPPFFFEKPDLDPGGKIAEQFLADLVGLAVQFPPHHRVADEVILAAVQYLRSDTYRFIRSLKNAYIDKVASSLPEGVPIRRVPADVARGILDLLQFDEDLRFIYNGVTVSDSDREDPDAEQTWLVAVGERLLCFAIDDTPTLVWQGDARVQVRRIKRTLNDGCQITGGQLLPEPSLETPRLLVAGPIMGRYGRYFAPLVAFCSRPDSTLDTRSVL